MKIHFWTSTEYGGFMAGLIRELNERGVQARQRFQITESSYRDARSTAARLWLRIRQYLLYPLQLCATLVLQRITQGMKVGRSEGQKVESVSKGKTDYPPSSESEIGSKTSHHQTIKPSHSDEVCVVSTNTFFAPLLATFFHRDVVHLVYDLFPEAMVHAGKWQEGSLKVKTIRWLTRLTLRRARLNVFLGQRLKDHVESAYGDCGPSAIIPVGADQSLFPVAPQQRLGYEGRKVGRSEGEEAERFEGKMDEANSKPIDLDGPQGDRGSNLHTFPSSHLSTTAPTVLYCGNFGNMHDSATLFRHWKDLANHQPTTSTLNWRFHCSGPKRAALLELQAQLPHSVRERITIGGGLSQPAWIETMQVAEIALVTMAPGSETVVMPSKTYSAMMAGQAILAIAPEASDLVDLIRAADCGWWVPPGDVAALTAILDKIDANPEAVQTKRENAFRYAHEKLGQDALAEQWSRELGVAFA